MKNSKKNRVLALYKILLKYTDECHQISMREILVRMEEMGYECSEDSIGRYIKQLKYELGIDIISSKGRNAKYFIGNRLLEMEELKLLIDAVNASNFIERTIAKKIIDKLKETVSIYDSVKLEEITLGINAAKSENKHILYDINILQDALVKKVQISFDYMIWNKEKELVKKSTKKYTMNPWALIWANDRYYLYGYDVNETEGTLLERHYRVDKLMNIEMSNILRSGENQFKNFNANTYVSKRIGMFAGKEEQVTVRIPEFLIGAFIDQFGRKIIVSEEIDGRLLVTFSVVSSIAFLGWIVGLSEAEIVEPECVRCKMIELLDKNRRVY